MKMQKMIIGIGPWAFFKDVNEHLEQGWNIVPSTIVASPHNDGLICVVEHEQPDDKPAKEVPIATKLAM